MAESLPHGITSSVDHPMPVTLTPEMALHAIVDDAPVSLLAAALGSSAKLYLVGGAVRDVCAGLPAHDLDFCVDLPAEEVLKRLQGSGIRCLEMSAKHGTVIAVFGEQNIEITTFRGPARALEEDLGLRDFTVNAIAYGVHDHRLVDPCSGIADLKAKILRSCGDASERFKEDPLRVLRAVRFGPAAGFTVDKSTAEAATRLVSSLAAVSVERIRVELERILLAPKATEAFRVMLHWGILAQILPEMLPSVGMDQNEWHTEDVFEHTLSVIRRAPQDRILRWCALFHDLGKPATLSVDEEGRRHFYGHERVSEELAQRIMERLKFSTDDYRTLSLLVRQHMRHTVCGAPGVRRILRDLGPHYDQWRAFKWADSPPAVDDEAVQAELTRFDSMVEEERRRPKGSVYEALAIDGNDLQTLGMKPGPALGAMLQQLLEAVLDNPELNDRDSLLQFAGNLIKDA